MSLSRTERFKFKSRIVEEMEQENSGWDLRRTNILLGEFGFETVEGGWNGPSFEEIIAGIPDEPLKEMYSIVTGIKPAEVQEDVDSAESGNWKPGYVRLFLSHSASEKEFMGEVAEELDLVGIHGYVAHDAMEYSKPWQAQMELALRSMQALVAITHPKFLDSAWCQQEVGWAIGRRVPRYVIRMGADPQGFLSQEQWPSRHGQSPKQVAATISAWISSIPELGETVTEGLFAALESASSYIDAGRAAGRIAMLNDLTGDHWERLDGIYWANDQIFGGGAPQKQLRPFYQRHGRAFPPAKKIPKSAPVDPWATVSASNEPPF